MVAIAGSSGLAGRTAVVWWAISVAARAVTAAGGVEIENRDSQWHELAVQETFP